MNRIRTRRSRSALAVIALVATGLLATGAGGAVDTGTRTGGTLTIGLAEDPMRSIRRSRGPSSGAWSSCTCARSSTT